MRGLLSTAVLQRRMAQQNRKLAALGGTADLAGPAPRVGRPCGARRGAARAALRVLRNRVTEHAWCAGVRVVPVVVSGEHRHPVSSECPPPKRSRQLVADAAAVELDGRASKQLPSGSLAALRVFSIEFLIG